MLTVGARPAAFSASSAETIAWIGALSSLVERANTRHSGSSLAAARQSIAAPFGSAPARTTGSNGRDVQAGWAAG
jgi:hypothetical protein